MSLVTRLAVTRFDGRKFKPAKDKPKDIWLRRSFGWLILRFLPEKLALRLLKELDIQA